MTSNKNPVYKIGLSFVPPLHKMTKNLNPTEKLKILLENLKEEKKLYEYYLSAKIYASENSSVIKDRINFLEQQINLIQKEFVS